MKLKTPFNQVSLIPQIHLASREIEASQSRDRSFLQSAEQRFGEKFTSTLNAELTADIT